MRQLGADIDVVRPPLDRVEVVGKALPAPTQAFVQRRTGDVLNPFHQLDQAFVVARADRRKTDAAVAHHRGGHAVPARGRKLRVPHYLPVVMGVDVHETRRHEQAAGVDLLLAAARQLADLDDPAVANRNIGASERAAQAVGDLAAADDQIKAGCHV